MHIFLFIMLLFRLTASFFQRQIPIQRSAGSRDIPRLQTVLNERGTVAARDEQHEGYREHDHLRRSAAKKLEVIFNREEEKNGTGYPPTTRTAFATSE